MTGLRVVLAEDDVLLRESLATLLQHSGFEVVGRAGDGPGLLEQVRQVAPDLVVADIRMPPTHTTEGLQAAWTLTNGSRLAPRCTAPGARRPRRSPSAGPARCAANAWRCRCDTGMSVSMACGAAWSRPSVRDCGAGCPRTETARCGFSPLMAPAKGFLLAAMHGGK
jgi:hypothetical protein